MISRVTANRKKGTVFVPKEGKVFSVDSSFSYAISTPTSLYLTYSEDLEFEKGTGLFYPPTYPADSEEFTEFLGTPASAKFLKIVPMGGIPTKISISRSRVFPTYGGVYRPMVATTSQIGFSRSYKALGGGGPNAGAVSVILSCRYRPTDSNVDSNTFCPLVSAHFDENTDTYSSIIVYVNRSAGTIRGRITDATGQTSETFLPYSDNENYVVLYHYNRSLARGELYLIKSDGTYTLNNDLTYRTLSSSLGNVTVLGRPSGNSNAGAVGEVGEVILAGHAEAFPPINGTLAQTIADDFYAPVYSKFQQASGIFRYLYLPRYSQNTNELMSGGGTYYSSKGLLNSVSYYNYKMPNRLALKTTNHFFYDTQENNNSIDWVNSNSLLYYGTRVFSTNSFTVSPTYTQENITISSRVNYELLNPSSYPKIVSSSKGYCSITQLEYDESIN